MIKAWGITDRGRVRTQNQDDYCLHLTVKQQPAPQGAGAEQQEKPKPKLGFGLRFGFGFGGGLAPAADPDGEDYDGPTEKLEPLEPNPVPAGWEEQSVLAAVCDGMGGAKAGNIASHIAVETFSSCLQGWEERFEDPVQLLRTAAQKANSAVFQRAQKDPDCRGMGTTLVAVLIQGQTAYFANVGDSRAYLIRAGQIAKVTRDHSVVEDLVLRGEITPDEARSHPQKNLITRALGPEEAIRADLFEQILLPGDFILLCSDGLSNMVSDEEMCYEILHGGPPEDCCQRLLDTALSRGAPDNVTIVLIQCV